MKKWQKTGIIILVYILALSLVINAILITNWKKEERIRPSIHPTKKITVEQVYNLLEENFPYASIVVNDYWYYLISKEEFDKLMEYDKTDKHSYTQDVYDCDDFAFDFWRNITRHYHIAMGVAFVSTNGSCHAVNFFIDDRMRVHLIEPQQDAYTYFPYVYYVIL